jgi:hypothetical protein
MSRVTCGTDERPFRVCIYPPEILDSLETVRNIRFGLPRASVENLKLYQVAHTLLRPCVSGIHLDTGIQCDINSNASSEVGVQDSETTF